MEEPAAKKQCREETPSTILITTKIKMEEHISNLKEALLSCKGVDVGIATAVTDNVKALLYLDLIQEISNPNSDSNQFLFDQLQDHSHHETSL